MQNALARRVAISTLLTVSAVASGVPAGAVQAPDVQYQMDYPLYGGIDDAYDTWTYLHRPSETQNGRSNKFTSMPVNLLFHNNATLKRVYDTYRLHSSFWDYWRCGGGGQKWAVFRDARSNPNWVREDDAREIGEHTSS